jgi:16S rRNA (cytidine1402-2'-O)-methyltransferase
VTAAGTLHLVATPIGNLGDLSPRAVQVLGAVGLVCCEDTRRTGRLLQHAGVHAARLAVCNEHTETSRIAEVLEVLGDGRDVALVSDAGTPGISDPGRRLVAAVVDAGHLVSTVPGPSAVIGALVVSGLPTDRFVFEGFLPRAGRERAERLAEVAAERRTVVLYEAPHRIQRTLADLTGACGPERPVALVRELTKLHEEVLRGTLGTVQPDPPRGEFVIVLGGATEVAATPGDDQLRDALRAELASGASRRDAAATVSRTFGVARRSVYALATALPAGNVDHGDQTSDEPTDDEEGRS